jgi:hypothetical protein
VCQKMNDQNSSHQKNNSLDNILKELEERFGMDGQYEEKSSDTFRPRRSGIKKFSQSQVIGGLTLVLLMVGAAVGVYLGQTNQEIRQQASNAYPNCGPGSAAVCEGAAAGQACQVGGTQGRCLNTETNPTCTCVPNTPAPDPICSSNSGTCSGLAANSNCAVSGNPSGGKCVINSAGNCSCVPGACIDEFCITGSTVVCQSPMVIVADSSCVGTGIKCTCGTSSPSTNTPTRTPTTVPPTGVPPTGVPPTGVPPTGVPPTNTPTSGTTGTLQFCKIIRECGAVLSNWSSIPSTSFTMTFTNSSGFSQTVNIPSSTPNTTLPGGFPAFCTSIQVPQRTQYSYSRENISSFGWETQVYFDTVNTSQTLSLSNFCTYGGTCNGTAENSDGVITLSSNNPTGRVVVLNTRICSGPSVTPTPTTPAATCNGISISYGGSEPNRPVRIGDVITLTCGSIAGANRYEFRIIRNGSVLQNLSPAAANSRVSQPFTIAQSGNYGAQCRMCTDSTANSCQPWESLP